MKDKSCESISHKLEGFLKPAVKLQRHTLPTSSLTGKLSLSLRSQLSQLLVVMLYVPKVNCQLLCFQLSFLNQLGGGLELALQADILLAAPSAQLGQPEINLGTIPGGGGTQRLARLIGKSHTMELVLTGRMISADEAESWGIARVVRDGSVVDEAVNVASEIASKGRVAVNAGKEAVNAAFEMSLAEGLRFEKRLFHALFATKDQKEGRCLVVLCDSYVR
jgi:1,4-dihydroxy-2-naphthoyl-CoA synthase